MTIIGVAGAIGSGKSFTQLKEGLKYANDREKQLVTNFSIDRKALYKYASTPKAYDSYLGAFRCELKKFFYAFRFSLHSVFPKTIKKPKKIKFKPRLPWIKYLCQTSWGIIQIPYATKLEALLIPESVVLLDEAGILLNSRDFKDTTKDLLSGLCQSRKDGTDLIWAAQFDDQVDRQLRMLTQFWIHCESLSIFDKKMKRPKLHWKAIHWFRASDYQDWLNNPRDRSNSLKTRFQYATKTENGLLSIADKMIFSIFDSFTRLDFLNPLSFQSVNKSSFVFTKWHCKLPKDYYFSRLLLYSPRLDPFSKIYQPLCGYWRRSAKKKLESVWGVEAPNKNSLIREAIQLVKKKGIKSAPRFKDMELSELQHWINSH